jgi:hypothetical protein
MMGKQMTDKKVSKQARAEALKIARGTQRPGQKKEQTKLIAKGEDRKNKRYINLRLKVPNNHSHSSFHGNSGQTGQFFVLVSEF